MPASGSQADQRYALIVDQFEEIITAHSERWQEREGFFRQLNQAMLDDPNLWVVLTLREDYVAALDPYAPLMADRLRARFYMERMGVAGALEAVRRPAELEALGDRRRPFAPGVAEQLVDNLRQMRVPGQQSTCSRPERGAGAVAGGVLSVVGEPGAGSWGNSRLRWTTWLRPGMWTGH